jgi:hypothetical protein
VDADRSGPSGPAEAAIVPYASFEVGLYPLFELFKIIRGFIVLLVVANYVSRRGVCFAVLAGIAATTGYMGFLALKSRYLTASTG